MFLERLKAIADAKVLKLPHRPKAEEKPLEKKIRDHLARSTPLKGSSHVEKMLKAAEDLAIKYRPGSVFYLYDAIDAFIVKKAGSNHDLSKIVFKIKELKATQRRDLSTDAPAKEIEKLREKAVEILTSKK